MFLVTSSRINSPGLFLEGFQWRLSQGQTQPGGSLTWEKDSEILVLIPPSHTRRIIYITSVKQWISGPHLQFVSSRLLLTFSDVMNDSLFGVFCHNYFVNTTMHHDWCQLRFPLLSNCQPKCQGFSSSSLWDAVVALGIAGFQASVHFWNTLSCYLISSLSLHLLESLETY